MNVANTLHRSVSKCSGASGGPKLQPASRATQLTELTFRQGEVWHRLSPRARFF
jgi:hypothetical protein